MAIRIYPEDGWDTNRLLGEVLQLALEGHRVRFLVDAGNSGNVVQRLRVALSRSRNRHRRLGRPVLEFTLKHESFPWTEDGKRHDCIIMWTIREQHHEHRELLDDLMERRIEP